MLTKWRSRRETEYPTLGIAQPVFHQFLSEIIPSKPGDRNVVNSNCIDKLPSGDPIDIILVFSELTLKPHLAAIVSKVTATLSTACLVTAYNAASSANFDSLIFVLSGLVLAVLSPS